jgi:hypothetical protein
MRSSNRALYPLPILGSLSGNAGNLGGCFTRRTPSEG